jgi:four helix bundle protein
MKIEKFEDIQTWQKANKLALDVYKMFNSSKDFSFRDQIRRAAVSVMNNIAEGYERHGNKEFRHFLYISKGSCAEVRSMLYLALELKYIDQEEFQKLANQTVEISKMLSAFIKSIK